MILKTRISWRVKVAAKLALSQLPIGYGFWKRLGLFQHGHMEQPDYACGVFKKHFDRVDFARKKGGFVALELGPGDSLSSALIASASGASATYLIDTGSYAQRDFSPYRALLAYLERNGQRVSCWSAIHTLDEMLAFCNAHYEVDGLASLRRIPDHSVDFVWSNAVCEHLRKEEFPAIFRELSRVLRPDGVQSHTVDLRDHLGGALNNLRFSESFWERKAIINGGFYTNRIRCSEMIRLFQVAGFHVELVRVDRWESLPTSRSKIAAAFQSWCDDELRISGFDVILRPRPPGLMVDAN